MVDYFKRELKLVSIHSLVETEEYSKKDAIILAKSIEDFGFWTVPIAVDSLTFGVMDGHHRLNAAKLIGLARVPCIVMSYETGGVILNSWRDDLSCNADDVRKMIKISKKYPLKTTRHTFNPSLKEIKVPIGLLY